MSENSERNIDRAWSDHANESSSAFATRQAHPLSLPPFPPMRFPSDGYDFRRPVMSSHSPPVEEIIDLTNEPDTPQRLHPSRYRTSSHRPRHRAPRFGRNIMTDIVDLEEDSNQAYNETTQGSRGSPEVQFVRATVRSPAPISPRPIHRNFPDILNYLRYGPPTVPASRIQQSDAFRQGATRQTRLLNWNNVPNLDPWLMVSDETEGDLPLLPTEVLQFPFPGVVIHNGSGRSSSSYKPPTPPPAGFTRSVEEDDEVVCPNCDRELGIGEDDRQQIWVSKQCGHVR